MMCFTWKGESQSLSTSLQGGIRFFQHRLPSGPSPSLALRIPLERSGAHRAYPVDRKKSLRQMRLASLARQEWWIPSSLPQGIEPTCSPFGHSVSASFAACSFTGLYGNASRMFNPIRQSQSIIRVGLSDARALSLELRTIGYPHARPDRDTWVSQGLALGHCVQELSFDPFRSHVAKHETGQTGLIRGGAWRGYCISKINSISR